METSNRFACAIINFALFVTEIFLLESEDTVKKILTVGEVLFIAEWSLTYWIVSSFKNEEFGRKFLPILFIFSLVGVAVVCGIYHETFQFINLGVTTLFTLVYFILACKKSPPERDNLLEGNV